MHATTDPTETSHGMEDDRSETDPPDELSEEDVFEVLSNRRRRFVIHAVKRADEPPDVSELSRYVTAWELDIDPEDVPYEDRHNVHSTLKRTHIPKLVEKNVVTVDEDDFVQAAPALEEIDIYVEVLRGKEIPWSLYYVGLAGVAVGLLLAVQVGVPVLGALSPLGVGVFAVTAFGISAAVHYVIGRRTVLGNTDKPPEVRRRE